MATNKEHYTVLTYNINGYEVIHPVKVKSDRTKYIMVTDDPNLKDESGTWEVVYDDTLTGSTFDKCYQIRFSPWRYTDDRIVLRIDGSVGIEKNLDPIIDRYTKEDYDISLMLHPTRATQFEEYAAWVQVRGYDVKQATRVLSFMQMTEGFNVKEYKGMAQMCYEIQTRNRLNEDLNRLTYAFLKYLGDGSGIERVDQTVFSFVLQKYFPTAKIMWVDERMYNGEYFTWHYHNSNNALAPVDVKNMIERYWLNKKLHNVLRPQDF